MLEQFATTYNLRVRRDECGDLIVPAKHGHLYQADEGKVGVCFLDNPPSQASKGKALLSRRRQGLAAGFVPHQIGEVESILLFDPKDDTQSSLAIRLVGAKQKRVLSPETRAILVERMKRFHAKNSEAL